MKDGEQQTILIVDDDRELLALLCSEWGNKYKILTGQNGEEALRFMLQSSSGEVAYKEQLIEKTGPPITEWNSFVTSLFPPE